MTNLAKERKPEIEIIELTPLYFIFTSRNSNHEKMIGLWFSLITVLLCCLARAKVCYGKYRCFSNAPPFNGIVLLPLPPLVISPKFDLYTRSNMNAPQTINDHDISKLQQSYYSGSKRTVFVVHGYIGNRIF